MRPKHGKIHHKNKCLDENLRLLKREKPEKTIRIPETEMALRLPHLEQTQPQHSQRHHRLD